MLEEMGEAVLPLRLVLAADVVPDLQRHHRSVVVLQDDDLHMVSQGMGYLYPNPSDPPDVWEDMYGLGNADLVKFAESLGADAYGIDSPADLKALMPAVLERANKENRPQVIIARINKKSLDPYFPPKQ